MTTPYPSQIPQSIMKYLLSHPNCQQINPRSFCLHPYFPTPYDVMAYRFQAMKSAQMPETHAPDDIKSEFPMKFEPKSEYIPKPPKVEPSDNDHSVNESVITTPSYNDQTPGQADFKTEVEKLIRFLLGNMGKDNEDLIKNTRNFYQHNPILLEIYDKLSMKYYSAKKCKEDIIRYILRKIFRHLRISIMKNENVSSKKATLLLSKRYFQANAELSDIEDEDKFLESLMPYNKNSKNKTMNINFILEIFSSAAFCQEYQNFLPNLNAIIAEENKKKEKKLITFILECVERKYVEKIGTTRRLPWLDVWTEDAKNLAIAIMPNKRLIYNAKKSKY